MVQCPDRVEVLLQPVVAVDLNDLAPRRRGGIRNESRVP
jgi:hypothetical protein